MDPTKESPHHSPTEIAADDHLRSQYVRQLLGDHSRQQLSPEDAAPRVLVQFWDDADNVPSDVRACMETWAPMKVLGFTRLLFDDSSARRFINKHLDTSHVAAFDACTHPAMRADYFRLCYVLRQGGVYVDADDEYQGGDFEALVHDGRLRVQALCYDIASDGMVDVASAITDEAYDGRIFYVNNNPLIAGPANPVIALALANATEALTRRPQGARGIQSLTGPGNLTTALVQYAAEIDVLGGAYDFEVLMNWDDFAVSKWPLAYRDDERNWRNWVRGETIPRSEKEERS
ncbi:hypothetical protein GCM10022240_30840 [Microbacterium kribbense]|uniref:Glycosyl transferase n=1 Tax=Microbacterium kribbense TaxID=433645 RepID=A0ABP7GX44_9MICO